MSINFLELNIFLFFIEYFFGIIIIYLLVLYLLLVNNISGILISKSVCDCLAFIIWLLCLLSFNDSLLFLIDLNQNILVGLNQFLLSDYLSIFSKLIILILSFIFFIIISNLLNNYDISSLEVIILVLMSILALLILCSSFDLSLIFISIELVGLSSYFLASIHKTSFYSIECGVKYLIVGVVSSSFFLLGVLFFYWHTGSILLTEISILTLDLDYLFFTNNFNYLKNFVYLYEYSQYLIGDFNFKNSFFEQLLLNNLIKSSKPFFELGFFFLFFSICIKLSLVPFHFWSLSIYENSNTIVTFFFMLITKLSYFVIFFRIYNIQISKYDFNINFIFLFIGFISIIVGSFANLRQKKLKTILVYSSISHMGYVFLLVSINCLLGLEIACFYLFIYFLSNIIIWYVILMLRKKTKNYAYKYSKNIGDIVLLNKSNKIFSFGLLVVLFSIGGLPPFIGFFAKLGVFLFLISEKIITLTLLIIVCSAVAIFYYIRLIKIIYFENYLIGKLYHPINNQNMIVFCLSILGLILLFFTPKLLYLIIQKIILFKYKGIWFLVNQLDSYSNLI